jgi:septal ring factor EnvC (AmiA/AmiB activator)
MTMRFQIKFGRYYIAILLMVLIAGNQGKSDDILEQKKELEKIKQDMDNSQKALDSIKNIEKSVLKEISNYDQQASANQAVLKRLNNRLSSVRKSAALSRARLESSQGSYKSSEARYLSNLTYYYAGSSINKAAFTDEIEIEKNGFRKMVYLKALAAFDKEDLSQSSQYLAEAELNYSQLRDEERLVGDAQKQKKSEYVILSSHKEKKERDLSKLRLKKEREADRLLTLSETARQMEDLVARLEKARKARQDSDIQTQFDFSTGNFASYKGSLHPPLKGKVISGYGWKTDRITNLKSFSPGIEITGQKKSSVNSIASGVIAYIGELRGYGNFLIVEHEDGYYSMYSGLENLIVEENQMVSPGEKLGNSPTGTIKFELRKGREPIDPIEWIKIDAF